jgi:hypothetical protein
LAEAAEITAPVLTLPAAEAEALRAACAAASVILEYGSGGSTLLAASAPGRTVFSVESDPAWIAGLKRWFAAHPPPSRVILHHADVGPTARWGMPVSNAGWARFHRYPLSVWDRPDFLHPDLVLVDGRFRVGCFLAVLFRITRPVTLLFDDYALRPPYRAVERYARPEEMIGRMARFTLAPMPVPATDLGWIIDQFTRKQ